MFADTLFAMDWSWWKEYERAVRVEGFAGERVTCAERVVGALKFPHHGVRFSGEGAILLAVSRGCSRVILLGYDCKKTAGRAHHHGNHPKGLGNAGKVLEWPKYLLETSHRIEGVEVVNCSRDTVLTAFPRARLEDVL